MDDLKKKLDKLTQQVIDRTMGNGLMQEENTASGNDTVTDAMAAYARRCGAESCVLLSNDGTLPLKESETVAVFGRCQLDWFYVGYGSGGDVHPPYHVTLMEGLLNAGIAYDAEVAATYDAWCNSEEHKPDHGWWGHWPMSHPEMPLEESLVKNAAKRSDTAIVVIGRAAGEDRENTLTPGSYYLTEEENRMLHMVTKAFTNTVVLLNIGGVMDMSWIEGYGLSISSVLLVWQGGMESGNAVADVLTGKVSPCGKLSDTIAKNYEDYPSSANFGGLEFNNYAEDIFVGYRYFETKGKDKVLYPFGYGLSYTEFALQTGNIVCKTPIGSDMTEGCKAKQENKEETGKDGYRLQVTVENTGSYAGREVVQLYGEAPCGKLEKAKRVLVAYGKTKNIVPGEKDTVTLSFDEADMASYDEAGVTGYPHAFVMEPGTYNFYMKNTHTTQLDAKKAEIFVGSITYDETKCIAQYESVCNRSVDLRERILSNLPEEIPTTEDKGYLLSEVAKGTITLEEFIAQLSDEELEALTRGEGEADSPLGTSGNVGAFGGVIESLRNKGVPAIITVDGPSGIRLKKHTGLLPCGTALACTWDDALVENLFVQIGKEMRKHNLDILLAPGLNIHRNPLCGRNFEYFSEDPLVSGKMAAAVVRGVQSQGLSCCPKHFACNNQEVKRNVNDSRVSERALREIYLRGFEICVKEGKPNTIMTSYNKVNGVWSHYNYDLATTVLRKDWGFEGVVITDWWMQKCKSPEFPKIKDNGYRVRAQVDVLMPGNMNGEKGYASDGTLLKTLGEPDGITRGELQRTARTVLKFILKTRFTAV